MARIAWVEDKDGTGPLAELYAAARAAHESLGVAHRWKGSVEGAFDPPSCICAEKLSLSFIRGDS